jgi:FdhD protein
MRVDTRRVGVLKVVGSEATKDRDMVVRETPLTIFLNDDHLVTLMCSPRDAEHLVVGFLFSEGLIRDRKDIRRLESDVKAGSVWVETAGKKRLGEDLRAKGIITTGCGRGMSFMDTKEYRTRLRKLPDLRVSAADIASLMKRFQGMSPVYKETGGVHSAALATARTVRAFSEDIGRHNAVDKVLGRCVLEGIDTSCLILLTSGRASSDILVKAARAGIRIIVSRAAPTDLSIRLARDHGMTLIGFARGLRMNVYSNEWRVGTGPASEDRAGD